MSKVQYGQPQAVDAAANSVVTGIRQILRDDFNGSGSGAAAVDANLWDLSIGAGMSIAASASSLNITSGTTAGSTTSLVSKQSFSLPLRAIMAWRQTLAKQANQAVRVEMVAVAEDGSLDENNKVWFESTIGGTSSTALQVNTVTDGIASTASPATGVSMATADNLLEIAFDPDQIIGTWGVMNTAGRTGVIVRDNNLPNIDRYYKLRLSVINDVGFAGSSNVYSIYFVTGLDLTEVQAEIAGGRGAANTTPVSGSVSTTEATLVSPSVSAATSAASTNATLVKATAGNLYAVEIANLTAATIYLKLYSKSTAPTVGTDVPQMTIPVAAGGYLSIEYGRIGRRFAAGIGYAITAAAADADATAIAAGAKVVLSYL